MDIPMKAEVYCVDGYFGRSTGIIIVPLELTITRLIVKAGENRTIERMVPPALVAQTAPDTIWLSCSTHDAAKMTPFAEVEWTRMGLCHWAPLFHDYLTRGALISPHRIAVKTINLLPDEIAVRHSARVETIDGRAGQFERAMVDATDWRITCLVLRNRWLRSRETTTVPILHVNRVRGVFIGAWAQLHTADIGSMFACPSKV